MNDQIKFLPVNIAILTISDSRNEDTDISGAFYVDFTLSGENIFAITSNYENFYIYWKMI